METKTLLGEVLLDHECGYCYQRVYLTATGQFVGREGRPDCSGEFEELPQVPIRHSVFSPIDGLDPGPCVEVIEDDDESFCVRCFHPRDAHIPGHGAGMAD